MVTAPEIQNLETEDVDVQVALILDTSSSMDGLVAQARAQIWEMVSELQVTEEGEEKTVAVALYQYGNSRLKSQDGFIEQLVPMTTDLDRVTVQLHSLSTSGGREYGPMAIQKACDEIVWDSDDGTEKFIVIAGNEGFEQGRVSGTDALDHAQDLDIHVLPIYCVNQGASKSAVASWKRAATLADTDFESIDPDQQIANIESPYDAEIVQKYKELQSNTVYRKGHQESAFAAEAEQCTKDGAAIDRIRVQGRRLRAQSVLGSYSESGDIELSTVALPQHVSSQDKQKQREFLKSRAKKQVRLQNELRALERKRAAHVTSYSSAKSPSTLGRSFRRSARKVRKRSHSNL